MSQAFFYKEYKFEPVQSHHIECGWLKALNNSEVNKYLTSVKSKSTHNDLKKYLCEVESKNFLACYLKEKNLYIGNLRLYQLKRCIFSYGRLVFPEYQNMGLGKHMAEFAAKYAFEGNKAKLIIVGNNKKNVTSGRSKLNAGYKLLDYEKIKKFKFLKNVENADYYYLTHCAYLDGKSFLNT